MGYITTALTFPRTRLLVRALARRQWARIVFWYVAAFLVVGPYALLRGRMDDLGLPVHGPEVEETLFGGLPTVWLQEHIFQLAPQPLEWSAVVVHASWFFVPAAAGLLVTLKRPGRVGSFFRWWFLLQAVALGAFALFPLEPPWMANQDVTRIIALRTGGEIYDPNQLAAMPSLHVAFPLLIGFWFLREDWRWPGFTMIGYAALIGIEVVFSGEHYVVDVAGALVVALAVAKVASLDWMQVLRRLWTRVRAAARPGPEPRPEPVVTAVGSQRAQTLLEFALLLPVTLAFLFSIVDFGIALDRRITIQHAVADGARRGAVDPDIARTIAYTEDESQGLLDTVSNPTAVTVCFEDDDGDSKFGEVGDSIVVQADFTYNFTAAFGEVMGAFGVSIPGIPMTPSATKRLEASTSVDPADQCA